MTSPVLIQEALFPVTERKCAVCGLVKPLDDFRLRSGVQGRYLRSECRICEYQKAREWRLRNPERMRTYGRVSSLKRYNLTVDDYSEMLTSQDGRCANPGCIRSDPGRSGSWHVDHDHACCSGKGSCGQCVRGLLCMTCNAILGYAKDEINVLVGLIDYLLTWQEKTS